MYSVQVESFSVQLCTLYCCVRFTFPLWGYCCVRCPSRILWCAVVYSVLLCTVHVSPMGVLLCTVSESSPPVCVCMGMGNVLFSVVLNSAGTQPYFPPPNQRVFKSGCCADLQVTSVICKRCISDLS